MARDVGPQTVAALGAPVTAAPAGQKTTVGTTTAPVRNTGTEATRDTGNPADAARTSDANQHVSDTQPSQPAQEASIQAAGTTAADPTLLPVAQVASTSTLPPDAGRGKSVTNAASRSAPSFNPRPATTMVGGGQADSVSKAAAMTPAGAISDKAEQFAMPATTQPEAVAGQPMRGRGDTGPSPIAVRGAQHDGGAVTPTRSAFGDAADAAPQSTTGSTPAAVQSFDQASFSQASFTLTPAGAPQATAAVAAPAPATPATPVQQVADATMTLVKSPETSPRIVLNLHPADLGGVQIKIDRSEQGLTHIEIVAAKPETLDILQRTQAQLHATLDAAGIQASGRDVTFHLAPQTPATADQTMSASGGGSSSGFSGGFGYQSNGAGDGNASRGGGGGGGGERTAQGSAPGRAAEPSETQPLRYNISLRHYQTGIDITA
jgi:flagellar hook-length control protein FliK